MKRLLAFALLAAACHGSPDKPQPGDTPPGAPCDAPADCGCWTCTCAGIGGEPGAAQLCKADGHCPSGEEACAIPCGVVDAGVASAVEAETCPGRP